MWIGAAVTAALFTVGKFLIGLYLGRSDVGLSFGAFGSLVIVMVWVYYSGQIFLLGAEFTWVYAHQSGSRGARHPAPARNALSARPAPAFAQSAEGEKNHRAQPVDGRELIEAARRFGGELLDHHPLADLLTFTDA